MQIFIQIYGLCIQVNYNKYIFILFYLLASVVCGIFQAAFWTAQSAYIADLGKTDKIGEEEAKENKYFGIFYATFQTSKVICCLNIHINFSLTKGENFTSSHDRFRPCLRDSSGGLFIFIITRRL